MCVIPSVTGRCFSTVWVLSSGEKAVDLASGDSKGLERWVFCGLMSVILSVLQGKGRVAKGMI